MHWIELRGSIEVLCVKVAPGMEVGSYSKKAQGDGADKFQKRD
jgi:hypothetical protein